MKDNRAGYDLNLASRPFVNMALPIALAVIFIAVLVSFSAFNLWVILSGSIQGGNSEQEIADAEARIEEFKQNIDLEDGKIKAFNIPKVSREVASANEIIKKRSMSWTRLFNRLETVSPGELRMLQISPNAVRENIDLSLRVEVPRQEVLRDFIDALKLSEHFSGVAVTSESLTKDGTQIWELTLKYYDAQ